MKELVLVPLWRRAGFARACLLRLAVAHAEYRAVSGNEVFFRLLLDEGHSSDVEWAAAQFVRDVPAVEITRRRFRRGRGNSNNILTGLADAARGGWDRVHVVEEDVFVSDGYFTFHDQAHRMAPGVFAVSACRNHNGDDPGLGPAGVWRHGSYQSLGVSMGRASLAAVTEHVVPEYFADMVGYCRRMFPGSAIPAPHAEQDGLINRVREQEGLQTLYPSVPRAYHAGFTGYNRSGGQVVRGLPHEVATRLLHMDSAELNALAQPEFRDLEAVPLDFVCDLGLVL
jgi:hypothetical protein